MFVVYGPFTHLEFKDAGREPITLTCKPGGVIAMDSQKPFMLQHEGKTLSIINDGSPDTTWNTHWQVASATSFSHIHILGRMSMPVSLLDRSNVTLEVGAMGILEITDKDPEEPKSTCAKPLLGQVNAHVYEMGCIDWKGAVYMEQLQMEGTQLGNWKSGKNVVGTIADMRRDNPCVQINLWEDGWEYHCTHKGAFVTPKDVAPRARDTVAQALDRLVSASPQ